LRDLVVVINIKNICCLLILEILLMASVIDKYNLRSIIESNNNRMIIFVMQNGQIDVSKELTFKLNYRFKKNSSYIKIHSEYYDHEIQYF